jgi:hypothetical protein
VSLRAVNYVRPFSGSQADLLSGKFLNNDHGAATTRALTCVYVPLTFASYECIPRASFTALIRSSTFTMSESYFTTASFFSKETLTSLTPFTASSADCTVDAQEPQVMPLISSVTVASFAATDGGIATIRSSKPTAATIVLVFMAITSGQIIPRADL